MIGIKTYRNWNKNKF